MMEKQDVINILKFARKRREDAVALMETAEFGTVQYRQASDIHLLWIGHCDAYELVLEIKREAEV